MFRNYHNLDIFDYICAQNAQCWAGTTKSNMGIHKYNYAWYRDKEGKVKEIFPESKLAPNYKYRTNWITFYK